MARQFIAYQAENSMQISAASAWPAIFTVVYAEEN
jgi:hypothetical protein